VATGVRLAMGTTGGRATNGMGRPRGMRLLFDETFQEKLFLLLYLQTVSIHWLTQLLHLTGVLMWSYLDSDSKK